LIDRVSELGVHVAEPPIELAHEMGLLDELKVGSSS
jgi:hypothetical protein